jgi:hypothetical protein
MPLADFTITIHDVDIPLAVRVVVHKDLRTLHSAVSLSDRKFLNKKQLEQKNRFKEVAAICQRFNVSYLRPLFCIVRFVPEHMGAGLIAHEMGHAAVWLWAIKNKFDENVPLRCDNDEWFCWILGELVRQTTVKFYETGLYT